MSTKQKQRNKNGALGTASIQFTDEGWEDYCSRAATKGLGR